MSCLIWGYTIITVVFAILLPAIWIDATQKGDITWAVILTILFVVMAIGLFFMFYIPHRNKKRILEQFEKDRKEWVLKAKQAGFKPDIKLRGSGRYLAIDSNNDMWCCINDLNPGSTVMHKVSDIRKTEKKQNYTQSVSTANIHVGYGLSLGGGDINTNYTKYGVLVSLSNIEHPTEFISCIDDFDEADKIISIFSTLMEDKK